MEGAEHGGDTGVVEGEGECEVDGELVHGDGREGGAGCRLNFNIFKSENVRYELWRKRVGGYVESFGIVE